MINNQASMIIQIANSNKKFDLEERTLKFGIEIINFAKTIEQTAITRPIISQLIRSGTSIGANYSEANECNSKKDFYHKINLAKKEAKETVYWLSVLENIANDKTRLRALKQKAHEFVLIFSTILKKKV
jgi:four helix bundle protein